ncbi:hypothetical protein D1007_35822 [Hordeum vulgare]|nr:hypothetical protein D1007_35822 [Hordeum vulgare]
MVAATLGDGSGVGGSDDVGGYDDLPSLGSDDHIGLDGSSSSYYTDDEEEEEEVPMSMEQRVRLVEMWVANPTTSHHWIIREGGVMLDDVMWNVRIRFDAGHNLDRKICSSDVTFLNIERGVISVDGHGVVFQSQGSNSSTVQPTQHTAMCTQESRNVTKGKLKVVVEEEEQEGYKGSDDEDAYDSDNNPFSLERYMIDEDRQIIEGKRLANEEDEYEALGEESKEEHLDYEGDTEVEDLFEKEEEVNVVAIKEPPMQQPASEYDDGHVAPAYVLHTRKKSRDKKRKPRIRYNEKLEQPHQRLCLSMCYKNEKKFREALLSLHITQARNFRYHRNSDKRIFACCKQEKCKFFIIAAVIKGEKTCAIKKMRLQYTFPSSTESSRAPAKSRNDAESTPTTRSQPTVARSRNDARSQAPARSRNDVESTLAEDHSQPQDHNQLQDLLGVEDLSLQGIKDHSVLPELQLLVLQLLVLLIVLVAQEPILDGWLFYY